MAPSNIAVLGGGITGLSAAFHLSRRFPSSRITLLEKTGRLGGWIRSKKVNFDIPGGDVGSALLELGPRTLRPQSKALLEMVNLLELTPHLIATPKDSLAARNRFLYIPEFRKSGLIPIPNSIIGHLTSRLSLITIPSVLREVFRRPNRPEVPEVDESFDAFMSRRFGSEFARVLGSALVHGIYAADSRKLSIKTAFAPVWDAETRGDGSVVKGLYRSRLTERPDNSEEYDSGGLEQSMKGVAVYSFKDGLESLTEALKRRLDMASNVEVRTNIKVTGVHPVNGSFKISTSFGPLSSSHLVSTVPLPVLNDLLVDPKLPHLMANPSSSVTVASFVFDSPPAQIHPPGFGYLIPRPKAGYGSSSNPEGVLGVVFDSCSLDAQDQPRGALTKLTMMLCGPHGRLLSETEEPSSIGKTLLGTLQRHFGRRLPRPAHLDISHHHDCIPTPGPGHLGRMSELRQALEEGPWGGRMEVVGAGVGGVSVGDCVEQGRKVGRGWV